MDTRAGMLILLVEDEWLIAQSEAKTIRSFGYPVVAVNTGAEALDQVRNNPDISLVLMDLGPGLDGPETCRKILALRELPIIFLTAHDEKHYIDQVRDIPHYGYLLKNSSDVILESSIEMALRLFESQKQARIREAHLLRAEKVAGFGTWEWNIRTGEDTFDENSAALLGYTLAELQPNSFETWMSLKHPDDHREADALLQAHLRGQTEVYAYESRMRHKNGSWVWVLGRGKITERDPDGKPLVMSGIHIDITQLRQAEKRIEELLAEKELLLKEVHHRVKNHLNTICSLLSLQADTVKEAAAAAALTDAGNRVAGMLVLYDELYRSDQLGELSIRTFLESLVDRVVAAFPNGPAVRVRKDIVDVALDAKRLQPLGIIVNELLTNSLKYAFGGASGGASGGTIDVSLAVEHGRLRLVYADDGPGLPEGFDLDHSGGFGLMLVRELARQLKGDLRLDRDKGLRFILEFEK